jgi:hypothetical protein
LPRRPFGFAALSDEPRAALIARIDPEPIERDAQPVADPDQKVDVGDAPQPPRDCPAQLDPEYGDAPVFTLLCRQNTVTRPSLPFCVARLGRIVTLV